MRKDITPQADRLSGTTILIHGTPKVGKTTLASDFPKPMLWLATETGYNYLPKVIRGSEKGNKLVKLEKKLGWKAFTKEIELLEKGHKYETLVVDTASMAYELCKRYFCAKHNISHPSERHDKGGLWSRIGDNFLEWMGRLATSVGQARLVLITHSREEEIETDTAKGVKKITVALTGQARLILLARPDHVFFMSYAGMDETGAIRDFNRERCLWIQGTSVIYAETRDRGLSRKAVCIDPLPEKGAYKAILKLFDRRRKTK